MRARRLLVLCVPALLALGLFGSVSLAGRVPGGPSLRLIGSAPNPGTINSDVAFWGKLAFAGNYDGFRVIDISRPARPVVLSHVRCRGPQGDMSVWGTLLFVSVDRPQSSEGCDGYDVEDDVLDTAFEGIRIFDVSDPRNPRFVKAVHTDCGSHTHTLVPDVPNGRVILYVSSYSLVAGPHCGAGRAENPLHSKISVVEVPLAAPDTASVIATPAIVAPPFRGGGATPVRTVACHDISVFLPLEIAAASCMSEGQIWDISDPADPKTLQAIHVDNPAFEFWHSATFSRDGKVIVWGDESLSSSCHSTGEQDGRLWFYATAAPTKPLSSYLVPPRASKYCSVHMFNVIPVKGRNLLLSGWYEAGTHVIDFTNPRRPKALAARAPRLANTWATYYYDGHAYASDIARGIDVFSLGAGLTRGARRLGRLNPQTQEIVQR
ncbi:MAG: LVIVD repeat-containing protein [Gaiellaceae bacterium]